MIKIYWNGEPQLLAQPLSLADFAAQQIMKPSYVAIAINREFIPRAHYRHTILQEGDRVDCVSPMQGG